MEGFHLSPQQKRRWSLLADHPEFAAKAAPALAALAIDASLAPERIETALRNLIQDHEILRTRFEKPAGMAFPLQVIDEQAQFDWGVETEDDAHQDRIEVWLGETEKSDQIKARLLLGEDAHLLMLRLPFLCADSWSLGNLATGIETRLGIHEVEDVGQYVQYSEWLRDLAEDAGEGLAFWSRQPRHPSAPLPLAEQGAYLPRTNSCAPMQRPKVLDTLAEAADTTPDVVALAAVFALTARLTGQTTLTLATAFHGRPFDELEDSFGVYNRSLPISATVDFDKPFVDLLAQVATAHAEADELQDYYDLDDQISPTPAKLAFAWDMAPATSGSVQLVGRRHWDEPFDFKIHLTADGDLLRTEIYYNEGKYSDACAFNMGERLAMLFFHLKGDIAVGDLPVLGEEESHQLLSDWSHDQADGVLEGPIHTRFEEQASRTPDATALVYRDQRLTYAQLNRRANAVAHWLRDHGAGPEQPVALCLGRSLDLVAALFGILKAGAAYLPIDPETPPERVAYILKDSGATLAVTAATTTRATLPDNGSGKGLDALVANIATRLDLDDIQLSDRDDNPPNRTLPQNLAYVIYTSGSSGRPKGVQVTHQTPLNLLRGLEQRVYHDLQGPLMVTLNAPVSFDAAMQQLVMLTKGHGLWLIPQNERLDAPALCAALNQVDLDGMDCTPAHLAALVESGLLDNAKLPRKFLVAGGAVTPDLWDKLATRTGADFYDIYGPTEATVDCTGTLMDAARVEPHIGRPLANYRIYLTDDRLQPCAHGVTGEILIGGDGLARCYLNRPALTAAHFVPDPFSNVTGARLYRSGDLARYNRAGHLVFQGRRDFQVKIRGNRVEPGEVEAAMTRHEAVGSAVVLALPDNVGNLMLVGYYTAADGHTAPATDALAAYLAEWLPDPYVPSLLAPLDAMPLTINGKIDRDALPSIQDIQGAEAHVPPHGPVEQRLAELWGDVLGLGDIGARDDFFLHGGHSLNGAILTQRVKDAFGVELSLRQLFENPTVRDLGHALNRALLAQAEPDRDLDALDHEAIAELAARHLGDLSGRPPIQALPRDPDNPPPLSFAQWRLWFIDNLENDGTYNNPTAVRIQGPLDRNLLIRCFGEIENRHEVLRTTFTFKDDQPVQVFHESREAALKVIDLADQDENALLEHMRQDAVTPFDLEAGPVWRATLFRLADDDHVVLVTMHHICSDAWSMRIFTEELLTLYRAFGQDQPSPLPTLPIQYADYAAWQRNWLQGDTLEAELDFWRKHLEGAPARTNLPYDHQRPTQTDHRGALQPINLSGEVSQKIRDLARDADATLFQVLLSAFYALLAGYDDRDDLVVGTDVANRNQSETAGLIGFFINQMALRLHLDRDAPLRTLIGEVRDTTLSAFEHSEAPFDKVVGAVEQARNDGAPPLFQSKFFMDRNPGAQTDDTAEDTPADTTRFEYLDIDAGAARLDLTMGLWDTPDAPIQGWLNFRTDLFETRTIARMAKRFEHICSLIAADADQSLAALCDTVLEAEREADKAEREKLAQAGGAKFKKGRRRRVAVKQQALVKAEQANPDQLLPLRITPESEVDLPSWLKGNRSTWENYLHKHGAILFRGFGMGEPEAFRGFVEGALDEIYKDNTEHQLVSKDGAIQTPVDYSSAHQLLWHNENSYNYLWPRKIIFASALPALKGGETPLVDSRRLMTEIPAEIVEEFRAKDLIYVRNYSRHLGLDWRQIFRTEDRAIAEQRCRESRLEFIWRGDDQLQTRGHRPSVWDHPVTGETCWFNQAQHWHFSCLPEQTRRDIAALYEEDDYPRNCYFGDGSKIPDEYMRIILDTYARLETAFPWEQGDVVLVDNLLAAHGRNPYEGPRKLLVCMGDMDTYDAWLSERSSLEGT